MRELRVVKRAVRVAFRHVLGQDGQFTHAIQGAGNLLQIPILRLRERNRVDDIRVRSPRALDRAVEPRSHRHARGVVRWVDDLGTGTQPGQRLCQHVLAGLEVRGSREGRDVSVDDHKVCV